MTPQVKTLLKHLQEHGSISQAEAGTVYRMRALPRRISDLEALGYTIRRERKLDPTGQRYVRYHMDKTTPPQLTPGQKVRVTHEGNFATRFGESSVFYQEGLVGTVVSPIQDWRGGITYVDVNFGDQTYDRWPSVAVEVECLEVVS